MGWYILLTTACLSFRSLYVPAALRSSTTTPETPSILAAMPSYNHACKPKCLLTTSHATGARVACPLTSTTITLTLVVDWDSVREVVAEICVVLLRQCLSCDNYGQCQGEAEACSSIQHTLKCLLHVDRLFGTSLKVWNAAF